MTTYKRIPGPGGIGVRYQKPSVKLTGAWTFVSVKRVPPSVIRLLDETNAPSIDFDDKPEKKRCLFCEGPEAHKRSFQGEMVALCDDHYYTKNIGQIAAELHNIKEREGYGILLEKPTPGSKKVKSHATKSKK